MKRAAQRKSGYPNNTAPSYVDQPRKLTHPQREDAQRMQAGPFAPTFGRQPAAALHATQAEMERYMRVGLVNFGNQCYLNSVLQCLRRVPAFRQFFTGTETLRAEIAVNPGLFAGMPLVEQFFTFFTNAQRKSLAAWVDRDGNGGEAAVYSAKRLKQCIGLLCPKFDNFQEQDAEELLQFFMDHLHTELTSIPGPEFLPQVPHAVLQRDLAWNDFALANNSAVAGAFYGQFESVICCESCGYSSRRYDPFHCVNLQLHLREETLVPEHLAPSRMLRVCMYFYSSHRRSIVFLVSTRDGETVETLVGRLTAHIGLSKVHHGQIVLVHLRNGEVQHIFGPNEVLDGYDDGFTLCAYQAMNPVDQSAVDRRPGDYTLVCLVHRQQAVSLGLPVIVLVPRTLSPSGLYKIVEEKMSMIVENVAPDRFLATAGLQRGLQSLPTASTDFIFSLSVQMPGGHNMPLSSLSDGVVELFPAGNGILHTVIVSWACPNMKQYMYVNRCITRVYDSNLFARVDLTAAELGTGGEMAKLEQQRRQRRQAEYTREDVPIYRYLSEYVAPEILEGTEAYHCQQCKEKRRATKTLSFSRLPQTLVIHLKRFEYDMYGNIKRKVHTPVLYPLEGLDLAPYVSFEGQQAGGADANATYRLIATVNHYGDANGGHYKAVCRDEEQADLWIRYNDTSCTEMDETRVITNAAYILFYERDTGSK